MSQEAQDAERLQESIADLRHGLALVGRDLTVLGMRRERNNRTRLSLLHIHAFTAIAVGCGIVANGPDGIATPAYAGVRLVPGAPLTVGAALVVLGVVLGVATWMRAVRTEIFALAGMTGWYLLWATSFAYAVIRWHMDPVGTQPSYQGMFAYWGWSALLLAHVRVLIWIDKQRNRRNR